MLLKDSVFVPGIDTFKCSLKMSVSLVLDTEHLKLLVESWKWRHHNDLFYMDTSPIWTLRFIPSVSVWEKFDCIIFQETDQLVEDVSWELPIKN